jgi:hypothetical protein
MGQGPRYIFTPTALYLEAEPHGQAASNAMRLSGQQLREALARLSPSAKEIAAAQAQTEEERERQPSHRGRDRAGDEGPL